MTAAAFELARYVINGLVATAAHYGILVLNLEVLQMQSAGVANFLAAIVGISVSYLGSRYFVFARTGHSFISQAIRFAALYGAIAAIHGLLLFVWTDWWGMDYRIGFAIAVVIQVSASYLGNKYLVFRP